MVSTECLSLCYFLITCFRSLLIGDQLTTKMVTKIVTLKGHYEIGLIWPGISTRLLDNCVVARERLNGLKMIWTEPGVPCQIFSYNKCVRDTQEIFQRTMSQAVIQHITPLWTLTASEELRVMFGCVAEFRGQSGWLTTARTVSYSTPGGGTFRILKWQQTSKKYINGC